MAADDDADGRVRKHLLHALVRTEKEGRPLRARPAVNKGRTADSTQLSIFDYSISRDTPLSRPVSEHRQTSGELSDDYAICCLHKTELLRFQNLWVQSHMGITEKVVVLYLEEDNSPKVHLIICIQVFKVFIGVPPHHCSGIF